MFNRILSVASVVVLFAMLNPAHSADLPPGPPPYKAPPIYRPLVFSWTGFYFGANAGYGWGRSSYQTTILGNSPSFNVDGGLLGVQMGYNYQAGSFVYGLEADIDFTLMSGRNDVVNTACVGCETNLQTFGTVRGRFGWALDRFMPYVTGGFAYGGIKVHDAFGNSQVDMALGWTAGAGLEYALSRGWSAKLEYLYTDLGSISVGGPTTVPFTANIGRIGLNARF